MAKTLRPLTGREQEAVRLADAGTDLSVIEDQTGLSRAQIAAAIDLHQQWASKIAPPPAPAITLTPAAPAAHEEPEPAVVAEPGAEDLDAGLTELLRRAAQSDSHRVRALADGIARDVETLRGLVKQEEAAAPLRAEIARLEEQLAARRRELSDILPDPQPRRTALANPGRARLYDPTAVRAWAREQHIEVSARGVLPHCLIDDYLAAHPAQSRQPEPQPTP